MKKIAVDGFCFSFWLKNKKQPTLASQTADPEYEMIIPRGLRGSIVGKLGAIRIDLTQGAASDIWKGKLQVAK